MPCTHTQSENKPIYHCWSNDIHLILMVVKLVNILCFDFVILFARINAFLFVYKQNKQNGSSFRVNGCWSGLAQLILLGSLLISLDIQIASAEIIWSADPARIRSSDILWWKHNQEVTCMIIHALITSQIDYCNSLMNGLPENLVKKLQRVQNTAARLLSFQSDENMIA